MKKFLVKSSMLALVSLIIISLITLSCAFLIPCINNESYQRGFVKQYRALESSDKNTPKAIVLGTSYLVFSVDTDQLSELLGMPVYNLGVNAGMQEAYIFDCAKKFINAGDIVIKPFTTFDPDGYGMESIYMSIDGEKDLLYNLMTEQPTRFLENINKLVSLKIYYALISPIIEGVRAKFKAAENSEDCYKLSWYADNGNYMYYSDKPIVSEEVSGKGEQFNINDIKKKNIEYLNGYYDFCNNKGAKFLITFPPSYEKAIKSSDENIMAYEEFLSEQMKAPLISNIERNTFAYEYIFNSYMHLNSKGKEIYTAQLAEDIMAYLTGDKQ